jgi:hypothetical protein
MTEHNCGSVYLDLTHLLGHLPSSLTILLSFPSPNLVVILALLLFQSSLMLQCY